MGTNVPHPPSTPPGLRINRVPSKPVQREADGRYAIHLWLQQHGKFEGDLALRLSPAEAETLHAQLCFALDKEPDPIPVTTPPDRTPDCRKPTLGSKGVHWP
jgi:hypothetical protein